VDLVFRFPPDGDTNLARPRKDPAIDRSCLRFKDFVPLVWNMFGADARRRVQGLGFRV
jgi:hypothetical protein